MHRARPEEMIPPFFEAEDQSLVGQYRSDGDHLFEVGEPYMGWEHGSISAQCMSDDSHSGRAEWLIGGGTIQPFSVCSTRFCV